MQLKKLLPNNITKYIDSKQMNNIFFVTGVMRSGTTLLQRIVAHSLNTNVCLEFDSLNPIVNSFAILDQYKTYQHLSRDEFIYEYQSFIRAILTTYQNKSHSKNLVLKDPLALKNLNYFIELMPSTKFIISVRNPLATVTSIQRVSKKQQQNGERSFISEMKFEQTVEYTNNLCKQILSSRKQKNVIIIRYEDLIDKNENTTNNLGKFIGETINLDLPARSELISPENSFWTPETGGEIKTSSLEKYKDELTEEQISFIKNKMRDFIAEFGY